MRWNESGNGIYQILESFLANEASDGEYDPVVVRDAMCGANFRTRLTVRGKTINVDAVRYDFAVNGVGAKCDRSRQQILAAGGNPLGS